MHTKVKGRCSTPLKSERILIIMREVADVLSYGWAHAIEYAIILGSV